MERGESNLQLEARGPLIMGRRLISAAAVVGLVVLQLLGRAQGDRQAFIPTAADGYSISQTNGPEQQAPAGFQGRTHTSMITALGITPATRGKAVIAHLTFSNKVRTCPDGDGSAEGDGQYTITIDSKDDNANTTDHFVMLAKAKYKGKVNDDAWLEGPVKAEIDFTSGRNTQHVTIPFVVGPGSIMPSFGPFSGGDPSHGRVSDAYDVGMGLAYWAAIYYGEAQHKWRDGLCAEASFDPPSRTMQPPPGTDVKVKASVKSKRGEVVKAHFLEVHTYANSRVSPMDGWSSDTTPLTFTFTAPNQSAAGSNAGFESQATSRAGIAKDATWMATLGTDWSGQIECSLIISGGSGKTEQQEWSSSSASRYVVEVKDGSGRARGYQDQHAFGENLRGIVEGGTSFWAFDNNQRSSGVAEDEKDAKVVVSLNTAGGTYNIQVEHLPFKTGKGEYEACNHNDGCHSQSTNVGIESCLRGSLSGQFTNPNDLSGSQTETQTGLGRGRNGTLNWNVSWRLSRKGTNR
jgi:hypothetical protein